MNIDAKYIECSCADFDDLTRICCINDEDFTTDSSDISFNLEFRIDKMPGVWPVEGIMANGFVGALRIKWFYIRTYFKNIWYAIKGKPLWYTACPTWDKESALEVAKFITDNIKRIENKHKKKRNIDVPKKGGK